MSRKTVSGPMHAVPCPHCGRTHDMRDLESQQLLDTGADITCEPLEGQPDTGYCRRVFTIVGMRPITVVTVRQSDKPAVAGAQPVPAARPGFLNRLLGK